MMDDLLSVLDGAARPRRAMRSEQREDGLESDGFDEAVVEARLPGAAPEHIGVICGCRND